MLTRSVTVATSAIGPSSLSRLLMLVCSFYLSIRLSVPAATIAFTGHRQQIE
jgi:hypothetical protein